MASPINSQAIEAALRRPNYIPSGTTASFLEQSRDEPVVIAILFIGTFITLIVALRCLARLAIVPNFGLDDFLALITLLPYWAFISLCIVLIHLGSGRHFLYIEYILDQSTINKTEVLDFAAHIIYTTALLICRLSGLAFYARITDRHDKLTWANWGAAAFIIAAYLPQLFLIIFHCLQVTGLWPYSFQPEVSNYTCLQWGKVYVTNSAISVICDLILFSLPVAIIHSLRMSMFKKLKLSLILMPGLLVIGISCTRMYLVIVGQWEADESWSYDYLLAIEVAEIGSTLLALSIPALKPLFGSVFANFDRNFLSRNATGGRRSKGDTIEHNHDGTGIELGSGRGSAWSRVLHRSKGSKGSKDNTQDSHGVLTEMYTPKDSQYFANAFHARDCRKMNAGSATSQRFMIQRDVRYSVSREEAGHG